MCNYGRRIKRSRRLAQSAQAPTANKAYLLSTPDSLGNWTDGRISCRQSAPTFFLLVLAFGGQKEASVKLSVAVKCPIFMQVYTYLALFVRKCIITASKVKHLETEQKGRKATSYIIVKLQVIVIYCKKHRQQCNCVITADGCLLLILE